jgi:hypothetical protein
MKAHICNIYEDFENAGAGAVIYTEPNGALIKCPGCGNESALDERQGDNHPSWVMDKQAHTFTPSIHHLRGCGWHGYLTNGEFVSV